MPSYESLIGSALLSIDPADRRLAEDRVTLKLLASRVIFCPYSGSVLDERTAVVIESTIGNAPTILAGEAWDSVKDTAPVVRMLADTGARVIDGRIVNAPKPRPERSGSTSIEPGAEGRRAEFEHASDGRVFVTYYVGRQIVRHANFGTERGARQSVSRFFSNR